MTEKREDGHSIGPSRQNLYLDRNLVASIDLGTASVFTIGGKLTVEDVVFPKRGQMVVR
jgi:hypothetical protein